MKPDYCECGHAEWVHDDTRRAPTACNLCQKCLKYVKRGGPK